MENMGYNAIDVAQKIVDISARHGDPVTNLKLQKLLYYTDAWHMVNFQKSLFEEDFQAWIHGPVVPSVYRFYKDNMYNPIIPAKNVHEFPFGVTRHILEILREFGGYSALQLETMTHREDPWRDARGDLRPDESSSIIIPKDRIVRYYSNLANA